MPSKPSEPSTWRLYVKDTDIPCRVISNTGNFDETSGSVTQVVLIPANRLDDFLDRSLPYTLIDGSGRLVYVAPLVYGDIQATVGVGDTTAYELDLHAKTVTWRSHVAGLPVDPFSTDASTNVLEGSYGNLLEVTIQYEPVPPDVDNFLTINSRAAGEFIHVNSTDQTYESEGYQGGEDEEENRDPYRSLVLTIPTTEWTITWHKMPRKTWNTFVYRQIQEALGKVNSEPMHQLSDAPAETILFTGFNFKDDRTWRNPNSGAFPTDEELRPCTVEFMFLEKHVKEVHSTGSIIHGHNSVYQAEKAKWRKVVIGDDDRPPYQTTNLNFLFWWADGFAEPED